MCDMCIDMRRVHQPTDSAAAAQDFTTDSLSFLSTLLADSGADNATRLAVA
jgi:hypothetical protein